MPLLPLPTATVHKPPMTATEHHAKGALCAAVATRDPMQVASVLVSLSYMDAARLILEVADDAAADRIRTADRMRRLKNDRDEARAEWERWRDRCAHAELEVGFEELIKCDESEPLPPYHFADHAYWHIDGAITHYRYWFELNEDGVAQWSRQAYGIGDRQSITPNHVPHSIRERARTWAVNLVAAEQAGQEVGA